MVAALAAPSGVRQAIIVRPRAKPAPEPSPIRVTHSQGPISGESGATSVPSVPVVITLRVRPDQNFQRRRRSANAGTVSAAGMWAMLQTASSTPADCGLHPRLS